MTTKRPFMSMISLALAGMLLLPLALFAQGAPAKADPAKSKAQFAKILSNLDGGGDLLVIANVEGLVERYVDQLITLVTAIPATDPQASQGIEMLKKLPAYLKSNGFYAIEGIGMSVVPRMDGLNTIKGFVGLSAAEANGRLWQGMIGGAPRRAKCLNCIPADAALVRTSTGDISKFWDMLMAAMAEVMPEKAKTQFDQGVAMAGQQLGAPVAAIMGSMGDEIFVSVQLAEDKKVSLPMGPTPMEIPAPSILFGIAVKDNTLPNLITAKLSAPQQPGAPPMLTTTNIAGIEVTHFPPLPMPIPMQPAYYVSDGLMVFGTTLDAVENAIKASKTRNGLVSTPEFKKAFSELPQANNGILYISKRFDEAFADLQSAALDTAGSAEILKAIQKFMGEQAGGSSSFAIIRNAGGVQLHGVSAAGGAEMIAGAAVAPMAMVAAIAIPSFIKARTKAKDTGCYNNLQQLQMAKDAWTLDKKAKQTDVPTKADILPYMNPLPVCPQGGTYTLNAASKKPTCSVHGDGTTPPGM